MLLYNRSNPPEKIYLVRLDPAPVFLDPITGAIETDLDTVLRSGTMLIFDNLPDGLEFLALDLASRGTLEIYGDSLSAAFLRKGRRGVRFAGLQGYGLDIKTFADLARFWEFLTALCQGAGTYPGSTPGSTAMRLVSCLAPGATSAPSKRIQEFANAAYSAGARHSKPGKYKTAWLYDIHSAYPAAMRDPLPFGTFIAGRDSDFTIARYTFDYESGGPFSPLWVRDTAGKVYHPISSKGVTCVLNSIDVETLQRSGTMKIKKRTDLIGCTPHDALAPVQSYLDDWQRRTPEYRQAVKILRNAIYGKLAQRPGQFHFTLKPIDSPALAARSGNLLREYNGYQFGLFRRAVNVLAFNHLPAAGAITAKVRQQVYGILDPHTIAVRTDSILSTKPRRDLSSGPLEGQWDLQRKGPSIVFGDPGFVIGSEAHMDGVQFFDPDTNQAGSTSKDRFDFGADRGTTTWTVAIEKRETVKIRDNEILIYHSPLAAKYPLATAPHL